MPTAPGATAREVSIPYGEGKRVTLRIPASHPLDVLTPKAVAPAPEPMAVIRRALEQPLETPPLRELARGRREVVIVVDDLTRLTPVPLILPLLLEELAQAGVREEQVTVLVALGTHRPMTEAELRARVGEETWQRVPVLNHAHWEPDALVERGVTENGTPVVLNRRVWEADLVLGVGSVFPHHIAGYSGGSKIIQPGVSGARTTAATHLLSTRTRRSYLGMRDNVVRREMDAVAAAAGLEAVFNSVLTSQGGLVDAFFGAPTAVLRAATLRADAIYGIPFAHQAEVVVAGTYPADLEFWQAHKALYAADIVTRTGGTLIVVTPCPEGLARTHPELVHLAGLPRAQVERLVDADQVEDRVAAGAAIAWAQVKERVGVSLVSEGIPPEVARAVGFTPFASAQEALEEALGRHGPEARVAVIPYAPECLPLPLKR